MPQQVVFNLYCYIVVGLIGNALIGWEFGKKGWIRLGLEGPKNKRVTFALFCFIGMMVWQSIGKLEFPLNSWESISFPMWGLIVFFISRFLTPKSQRLYNSAKFLHETTYTGNWHNPRPQKVIEEIRNNNRLKKAEFLYLQALEIQMRLSSESETDAESINHELNVAIDYCQLSLLYRQQQHLDKAAMTAEKALRIAESLNNKSSNNHEILSLISGAIFRLAEIEHVQGKYETAKEKYEHSLSIDREIGKYEDIKLTESMLNEIKEINTSKGGKS